MTPRQLNWLTLLLAPLLPVCVLYLIFGAQNFFGLDGLWRGVVATGPIAAYVFMVWLGWRIFQRLDRREIPSGIMGEWRYETIHADSTKPKRNGTFVIDLREDDLQVSGDYREGDTLIGSVHSRFAAWRGRHLYFSYHVTIPKAEGTDIAIGLCELMFFPNENEFRGNWVRLHSTSAGTIRLSRNDANAKSTENA